MKNLVLSVSLLLSVVVPSVCRAADCNGNGVDGAIDISTGTSQDCQPNGIPDECDLRSLYLGTQGGTSGPGRVYVYSGGTNWVDITPEPAWGVVTVMDLAFYNGKLYAATQTQHGYGGANGVGEVWRYDGGRTWTRIAPVAGIPESNMDNSAMVMEVYKDQNGNPALFVATEGMALKFCSACDGSAGDWVTVATSSGSGFRSGYVTSLCGQSELFLGELNSDDFWRFTWTAPLQLIEVDSQYGSCIWDLQEYDSEYDTGHLYGGAWVGTGSNGPVYRSEPDFLCDQQRTSQPHIDFTTNYAQNDNNRGVNVWALATFTDNATLKEKLYAGGGNDRGGPRLWSFDGMNWELLTFE